MIPVRFSKSGSTIYDRTLGAHQCITSLPDYTGIHMPPKGSHYMDQAPLLISQFYIKESLLDFGKAELEEIAILGKHVCPEEDGEKWHICPFCVCEGRSKDDSF